MQTFLARLTLWKEAAIRVIIALLNQQREEYVKEQHRGGRNGAQEKTGRKQMAPFTPQKEWL